MIHSLTPRLVPVIESLDLLQHVATDAARLQPRVQDLRLEALVEVIRYLHPAADSALLVRREGSDRLAYFSSYAGDVELLDHDLDMRWSDLADDLAAELLVDDLDRLPLARTCDGWLLDLGDAAPYTAVLMAA